MNLLVVSLINLLSIHYFFGELIWELFMLDLKKSSIMSQRSGIEDKIIRIPEVLRQKLNVHLGEFIVINKVALQVDKVFEQDRLEHAASAFVTTRILKQIGISENILSVTKHITMGCDPELFLVDTKTNQLYNPGFLFSKWDHVGYDGMLAELRPMPSINQYEVTQNIADLIKIAHNTLLSKNLNNVKMIAKSSGWNLFAGFHVHMGIPGNLLTPTSIGYGKILRIIVKALDYYIGTLSVLVEGADCGRRCSPFVAYGKVSDYRVDTRTLEYRVPGGALLKHPDLANGLIGLCSLVAHDVIERLRISTNDFSEDIHISEEDMLKKLYPNAMSTSDMFDVICSPSIEKAKIEAEKIRQDLECMINYDCYKESIDKFNMLSQAQLSDCVWTNWSQM